MPSIDDIVARTRDRVRSRPWPSISHREIEYGVPLFLTQLSDTLRLEATATPFSSDAIGVAATRHGAELLAAGFNVSQVVSRVEARIGPGQSLVRPALSQHGVAPGLARATVVPYDPS